MTPVIRQEGATLKQNPPPNRVPWYRRTRTFVAGLAVVLLIIIGATHKSPPATATINAGGAGASMTTTSPSPSADVTTTDAAPVVVTSAAPPTSAAPAAVTTPPAATTHAAPVHTTKVAASTCGAPSNPYGYTLCGVGSLVTSPSAGVCTYFNCIANFVNGTGYMVECDDGTYSMSGGKRGACSDHHGEGPAVHKA